MGLFSGLGKVFKAVSKVAGFIPGIGGTISKITGVAGNILDHKKPLGTTLGKLNSVVKLGTNAARGNSTQGGYTGGLMSAPILRQSPVLPGGAVATSSGPAPRQANPPRSFGGRSSGTLSRRRKKTSARAASTRKKAGRRLKFGSKAWRAKYMKKRRR